MSKKCFNCGIPACGLAWLDATYYFACFEHATKRPNATPRAVVGEALDRLHGVSKL